VNKKYSTRYYLSLVLIDEGTVQNISLSPSFLSSYFWKFGLATHFPFLSCSWSPRASWGESDNSEDRLRYAGRWKRDKKNPLSEMPSPNIPLYFTFYTFRGLTFLILFWEFFFYKQMRDAISNSRRLYFIVSLFEEQESGTFLNFLYDI
jgi:hypothetical protein